MKTTFLEGCLEEVGLEGRQIVRVDAAVPGRGNSSSKGSKSGSSLRDYLSLVCISSPCPGHHYNVCVSVSLFTGLAALCSRDCALCLPSIVLSKCLLVNEGKVSCRAAEGVDV